jgi:hypothetical protein
VPQVSLGYVMCVVGLTPRGSAQALQMVSCPKPLLGGKGQMDNLSAFDSMVRMAPATPLPATSSTSVPDAGPLGIMPKATLDSADYPIVTPLCWKEWESVLHIASLLEHFSDVPLGICFGFSLSVSSTITEVFSPPNHKSAIDNEEFVTSQIIKEVTLGHYLSPLLPASFLAKYGLYWTSPLRVVVTVIK